MRFIVLVAPIVIASLFGSHDARADTDSYRAEVLAVNTAAAVTWGVVNVRDHPSDDALIATTALLVLAAPVDHAVHDNWGRAGASFGAHVGFPVVGGLLGALAAKDEGLEGLSKVLVGVVLGHVAAVVTDVVLAHADPASSTNAPRMISFGGHF